jgi:hypothetical protein
MSFLSRKTRRQPFVKPRGRRLALEALEERTLLSVTIGVDAAANVHAISPLIYGAAFASTAQLSDLNLTINRNGGNASDTYSFQQDATNHGSDWFFESIPSGSGNGQGMDSWISATKAGGAQPSVTLNLFDWAAKVGANRSNLGSFSVAKYGPQQSTDPWNSNWGNGVLTNGSNVTGNDPNDAYVPNSPTAEQAWIQHLISTFGDSQNGGVQYYTLGNEPGLWNSTHRDIHPNGDTLPELRDRIISYASMVKSLDPNAQILGPEEWGWTNYFISGADAAAHNWGATYNGLNAEAWLLDQLRQHDAATGQRLLDYFTLHFYPQGGQFSNDVSTNMELLRNRSTRSLWDPNYVDESWIASTGINGGKVDLINQMKNWVNTYYPGTKIGITEYNWGAEGDMNGATTQADIWGIFGREGLDLANRWTTPATGTPTYLAMKLFRNYDGNGSAFGDTSVSASVANPDQVDAFSSIRSSDGALTIMAINKNLYDPNNPNATTTITIDLSNFASNGVAQEWQLAALNPSDQTKAAITHLSDIPFSGNTLTITVPQESVSLFVLEPMQNPSPAAPTGLKATASSGQVALTWTASTGATSYKVYRSTSQGGEGATAYQTGLTATAFTDTGVSNGTTYYYQISAVNTVGESARTVEVSATPQVPPPAAPTGLTAAAGNAQVTLTWTASTNATSYDVFRSTTAGAEGTTPFRTGLTATTFTDTGLTNGTTYFYQVRADNAGGASGLSAEASATPKAPVTFAGVHVNFTSDPAATPAGYVSDTGLAFGARGNGLSYGWNIDNSVNARDRESSLSPDELHDTFIHMQKPSDPNASWQIAVPNGTYTVHVAAGDPSNIDSVYKINVGGILAVNGTPATANHWIEGTVTVTVTNGLLVVSNATGSKNNKIDFIDVTPVVGTLKAAAVAAAPLTAAPASGPLPAPQSVNAGKFDAGFGFQLAHPPTSLALSLRGPAGDVTLTFDPSANAVGLSTGGPVSLKGTGLDLTDGHAFAARLHYDGVRLQVTVTDTVMGATWRHAFRVNLAKVVGATAMVDFSNPADVTGWWFQSIQ